MLKTAALSVLLRGITLGSKFILLLYLARFFSPTEIGLYGLIRTTIALFLSFVGIEFHTFNTRELLANEPSDRARLIRDQFVFHGVAYVVILPLALIVFCIGTLPWQYLFWFYLLLILEHLSQEVYRIMLTLSKPLTANISLFFRSGAWTYVLILIMILSPELRNLISLWIAWSTGNVVSLIIAVYSLRDLDWQNAFNAPIDWSWIKKGIKISLPLLGASLTLGGVTLIEYYTLEYYWGAESVGIYTFYSSIAFVLEIFVDTGVTAILYPKVVTAYQQERWEEYHQLMHQFARAVLGVSLPLFLSAAILIYPVLAIVQKSIYATNLPVYWLLLLSVMVAIVTRIPYYSLYAQRFDKPIVLSHLVGLGTSVLANLLLVPKFAQLGTALASLSAMLSISLVLEITAQRRRRSW